VGGACKQPPNTQDCCPTGVKNQIEHGDINLPATCGSGSAGTYKGLDEFRCPNPISGDYNQSCSYSDIKTYVEKQVQVNNKTVTLIDQSKWKKLNLLQQLTYFKGEIANWPKDSKIQDDVSVLNNARSTLASCYLATPYVDLLQTYKTTDQTKQIIIKDPETFSDPVTNNPVDVSKYCQGFNYDNSSCFKKCSDACPDTDNQVMQCYEGCGTCNAGDTNCQKKQESCIEDCYNSRPCLYGPNTSQTFGTPYNNDNADNCMSSCQNDCSNQCAKEYLPCSDEYKFCQSQCGYNGQCVLDNAGSCLFNAQGFVNCASQIAPNDQGNTDYCINRAYLCKNGSDQYAGYPDCADPLAVNCSSIADPKNCANTTGCVWDGQICSQNYSASFFYDKIKYQKCPEPYGPSQPSAFCYSGKDPSDSCLDICPETAKCPTSSSCPNCPCDQINQTLKFSVPSTTIGNYTESSEPISAHQMVGPQCNGYSYNDDPLTFYCEDNWWNDPTKEGTSPTPMGAERVASAGEEIPVGQTVDNAENWANSLINNAKINTINQDIQKMLDQMTKIGNAIETNPIQDYCKCNAKLENNAPTCTTNCKYFQLPVLTPFGLSWQCGCTFVPCKGSPCGQITDYLAELWNDYGQVKTDYINFYTSMLVEPRSDIMKELSYSRQTTNDCSLKNNAYGATVRLLDCTRVEDELISPVNSGKIIFNNTTVNSYCYGVNLGKLFDKSLTDNWFCAEEYSKNPTTTSNPIYEPMLGPGI